MLHLPSEILGGRNGSHYVLRHADAADAEQIVQLERSVVAEDRFLVSEIDEFDKSGGYVERELHDDPQFQIHVAAWDARIVGFISFKPGTRRRLRHHGSLVLCVSEKHRGSGVGSGLVSRLIRWADQDPVIEKLGLSVRADNRRAIGLYERHGFFEEGRLVKDVKLSPGVYTDSLLMCRSVDDQLPTRSD